MLCLQQPAPILPDHALLARTSFWTTLLGLLVSAALRRSESARMHQLDCFVALVQDEVAASHGESEPDFGPPLPIPNYRQAGMGCKTGFVSFVIQL